MWKDFFYFSRTERQGIIALAVLILGTCGIYCFLSDQHSGTEKSNDNELFENEYREFIASLKEEKKEENKRYSSKYSSPYYQREIRLASFDPNTTDSLGFLNLGLPPWMAKNILHYRKKGGKFRKPEDFKKVYGLTEEQYITLLPYINISEDFIKRDTVRLLSEKSIPHDTIYKYPAGTIIDLNTADTTELKKIPGIGSYIARSIINYRTKLGGHFYRIEQLQEIHLIVEKLRPWFYIRDNQATRINLNKSSLEKLMRHPYINYYQAKVIVEYRKKKGLLKNLKQLSLYEEFTPEDIERLSHYVCCD